MFAPAEAGPAWPPAAAALRFAAVIAIVLALAFSLVGLAGCETPPSAASLKEWSPADHHSVDDSKLAPAGAAGAQPGPADRRKQGPAAPSSGVDQLVDLTWRQQCTNCHGPSGKGDGQMGALLKVPDLTAEAWQGHVTDAEIAAIIRNGKGKMPNFDVPDEVIRGLVARVRSTRGASQVPR